MPANRQWPRKLNHGSGEDERSTTCWLRYGASLIRADPTAASRRTRHLTGALLEHQVQLK